MIISDHVREALTEFGGQAPFDHVVIDNFLVDEWAEKLEAEFPAFDDPLWHQYSNAIKVKKVCNLWNLFPKHTYQAFSWLHSTEFMALLSQQLSIPGLTPDPGLHGGGWHIHSRDGRLNTHLDYSTHPKLGMQRKLNLIVYLNSKWQDSWGGHLGLWQQKPDRKAPGKLVKEIVPRFNRAVLFDTTQDSWHGLLPPLVCPEDETRRSLAVYYLVPAPEGTDPRGKALFAPTDEQQGDEEVLQLIEARAKVKTAGRED
ncbi:2OG-Fe(II) oxygenase [Alteriqipengyuania sp.]|uniref:2OG-Fe(II) oxygenase n=1 Tax=Alteriqipengyuania sp. TaxID=2800692 RepID=UPI003512A6A8